MWQRLHVKMALSLVAVFVVVGALLLWLTSAAMNRYSQAVTQRMNAAVAMYVSDELQLIANGIANTAALQALAHDAMIINPSIEVYLLDRDGHVLSHALPPEQVVHVTVDLQPVQAFLRGHASLPLLGDDPGSDRRKIFSAHEVRFHNRLEGYVYIVLEGRRLEQVTQSIFHDQVFRLSALALVGCLAFGVLAALLIFSRFTRRVERLSQRAEQFRNDTLQTDHSGNRGDELDRLDSAFTALQQRVQHQMEQIRQADDMRRELIANISHDLRTPLTNMLGYIETLLLKRAQLDEAQQQHYLKITRNHGQRLGRLIADLFELAKLDSNAVQPQRETFSIAELIQDVVQDFAIRAEQKKVTLAVGGDLEDARVCADIHLMERVVENLLDNALRHTPSGGHIDVQIRCGPEAVQVQIRDNGEGIAPQDLPYIFERFFHVRDSQQDSLKSTGLGLAIVKRILDLHRTAIQVTSQLQQGTVFEFELEH